MKMNFLTKLQQLTSGTFATLFTLALAAPTMMLASNTAMAAQVQNRSIELSDSTPSGVAGNPTSGVGSGVGVTYQVQFDSVGSAQSLVIDFCANTPLIGDSCTTPTGFNAASATASTVAGGGAMGGWTVTATANHIQLSGGAAQAAGTQTFDLNGITNPSTTSQFYARLTTYASASPATDGYTGPATPGTYVDNGGFALGITNVIQITARVMETLQFCVLNATPTDACANADGSTLPNITLGHGTNDVLDGSAVDTSQVFSQLSTNAVHGAIIRAHLNNACGGLSADGGATCPIGAVNSGAGTPLAIQDGNTGAVAVIGLNVANGTGTIGSTTADANYAGSSVYGWDTDTSGTDTDTTSLISAFGDPVASSAGPTSNVNNTYTFAATAIATTPAGIYTGDLSLIATGKF